MTVALKSTPNYEYLTIEFRATRSLYRTAVSDSSELRVLIAKILAYSVVLFLMIAAFEAIVINGTKLLLNGVIWVVNTSDWLCFKEAELPAAPEIPPLPPVALQPVEGPAEQQIAVPVVHEPMPPLKPDEEAKFQDIVRTLATKSFISLAWEESRLNKHKKETTHLHPLQSLGYILEKNSERKGHVEQMFKRSIIPGRFVKEALESFDHPDHAPHTEKYMLSFSEKVGITHEAARGFLLQNPPQLHNLVIYILRN